MVDLSRTRAARNGVLADLRKSAVIADAATFKQVVIDGILKERGMISFASVLKPNEAEQVRAYIISRGHVLQPKLPKLPLRKPCFAWVWNIISYIYNILRTAKVPATSIALARVVS